MNQQRLKPAPTRSDSPVERAYAGLARCADDSQRIAATAELDSGDFRRLLQPAVRVPVPGQVRLRDHGSACLDPDQQGAPGTVQPLHRGARAENARRLPRSRARLDALGRARPPVRRDDRRPLRGGHCLQLRSFLAAQYRPRDLAARLPTRFRRRASCARSRWRRCIGACRCRAASTSNWWRPRLRDARILRAVQGSAGRRAAHRRTARAAAVRRARCARRRWRSMSWRPASFAIAAPSSWAAGCSRDDSIVPFVVALLNSSAGIYADARAAPGLGHPRPVQLRARQFSRDDAALLPDLRVPVQPDAAASAGPSLLDDRLQSRRQGRDPERDRRADAPKRPAASSDRPVRRARWRSGSPSMRAPTI